MSKALQDKIRAIMEADSGKFPGTKPQHVTSTVDSTAKKAAAEIEDSKGGDAVKTAKEYSHQGDKIKGKLDTAVGDFKPELEGGPANPKTVKEAQVPDEEGAYKGDDTSGVSGDSKTSKIRADQKNRLGGTAPEKLAAKVGADKQDDNNDNERGKLSPSAKSASSEKGGVFSTPQHESFSALFDGEELTEEFKTKAETIFEAAVAFAIEEKTAQLQEEFQQQVSEAVEEAKGELVEQIDGYLDYVVEQWLQDNAVALESGMKVELVSSFINGMKSVFQEHYIDIPDEKVDVVEEQAKQIAALEEEVQKLQEEKASVESDALLLQCEGVLAGKAEGLTAIEEAKFRSLAGNVEFETIEQFTEKVEIIREQMFKAPSQDAKKEQVTESVGKSAMVSATVAALQKGNLKFVRQ